MSNRETDAERVARWLNEYVAKIGHQDECEWDMLPGELKWQFQHDANELLAPLGEGEPVGEVQYREFPAEKFDSEVYPIKRNEVVVRWQDHPHGGGFIVEMNVAGNIAQTGSMSLREARREGKRAAERLATLHPPQGEREAWKEKFFDADCTLSDIRGALEKLGGVPPEIVSILDAYSAR